MKNCWPTSSYQRFFIRKLRVTYQLLSDAVCELFHGTLKFWYKHSQPRTTKSPVRRKLYFIILQNSGCHENRFKSIMLENECKNDRQTGTFGMLHGTVIYFGKKILTVSDDAGVPTVILKFLLFPAISICRNLSG